MKLFNGLLLIFACSVPATALSQKGYNPQLREQLDSILFKDQQYRNLIVQLPDMSRPVKDSLASIFSVSSDNLEGYMWSQQAKSDKANLQYVERILDSIGYPGKSMVGEPANEVVWHVIQHSPKIADYLQVIKDAGRRKQLPMHLVATMEDRYLLEQNKPQLYGSQSSYVYTYDVLADSNRVVLHIWPVADARHVNARRKKTGFNETVEDYAAKIGATYKADMSMAHFAELRRITDEGLKTASFEKKERIRKANGTVLPYNELSTSTFRYLRLADSFSRHKDSVHASEYFLKINPHYLIFLGQTPSSLAGYMSRFYIVDQVRREYLHMFEDAFVKPKPPMYDTLQRFYSTVQRLKGKLDNDDDQGSVYTALQKADSAQFEYLYRYVMASGWPAIENGGLYAASIVGRDIAHYYDYVPLVKEAYFKGQLPIGMARKVWDNRKHYPHYIAVRQNLALPHESYDVSSFLSFPGIGVLHSTEETAEIMAAIKSGCPINDIMFVHYTNRICNDTAHQCNRYCGHEFLLRVMDACPSFKNEAIRVLLKHYDLPLDGSKEKEFFYVIKPR